MKDYSLSHSPLEQLSPKKCYLDPKGDDSTNDHTCLVHIIHRIVKSTSTQLGQDNPLPL